MPNGRDQAREMIEDARRAVEDTRAMIACSWEALRASRHQSWECARAIAESRRILDRPQGDPMPPD